MKQLTPELKHSILTHYTSTHHHQTLQQILSLHGVTASPRTVALWKQKWDGTIESLQHQSVTGRPRALSRAQVHRHIAVPIRNANRVSRTIHYTDLLPRVQQATSTSINLRTIQRYGKEDCKARSTRGKKRTADESKCNYTCDTNELHVLIERSTNEVAVCVCLTFLFYEHHLLHVNR
jgi:hypothetical protein